ncbi:MAG: aldehyde dehydrogenase EutE [bacterium]|nr:aldehyde dehydrogenase EutE [bacterium]
MQLSEAQVASIVEKVVQRLEAPPRAQPAPASAGTEGPGVFATIDEAVEAAERAQRDLVAHGLAVRVAMVEAIRRVCRENNEHLARLAVEETGLGRVEDKVAKNRLVAERTPGPEFLTTEAVSDDTGLTIQERAPFGVLSAITPSTNPSSTIINNAIAMVSAGNSVVFNPHPGAVRVSLRTVSLLNEGAAAAGGPATCFTSVAEPTVETAQALMRHPTVALNVVTGGQAVVEEARRAGKRVIGAGPGNPPVVVDETADIDRAARDIVAGASFDNNIVCTDEKELIVVAAVADELKERMAAHGAYELNPYQRERLERLVLEQEAQAPKASTVNRAWIGKDARILLGEVGVEAPETVRLILCETDREHPFVWTELLMPILPLVRVKDVDEAIGLAHAAEHGFRHTAVIHSTDIAAMDRMARTMETALFVKNGPNYAGLGEGGAGYTSYTIATQTGEGLTTPYTFSRERRCTLVGSFRIV